MRTIILTQFKTAFTLALLLFAGGAYGQVTPFFLDAAPADTMVACQQDLPGTDSLRAVVLLSDGVLLDTVNVGAINTFGVTSDDCSGTILRIWVVSDVAGTARDTQAIDYRDTIAPSFALPQDTVISCSTTLSTPELTGIPTDLSDNCSPTDSLVVGYADTTSVDPSCNNCRIVRRTWRVTDECGNESSGIQTIRVADTIAPFSNCRLVRISIDPSGLGPTLVDPQLFNDGSTDNCGIETLSTNILSLTCEQIGQTLPVSLVVADSSSNRDTCFTTITVIGEVPNPTASDMTCGGDTLRLFANPPTATSGGISFYTYRWFGPFNNLLSTDENPVLPQVNQNADGGYRVEIRGLTGCTTDNVVNVQIGDVPTTPTLTVPATVICFGDAVSLSSPSSYVGDVRYLWFRGTPSAATPLDTTETGFLITELPADANSATFYVVAEVDGCVSAPSDLVSVQAVPQPVISVATATASVCQNEEIILMAQGDPTLTYRWVSPTGVQFAGANLVVSNAQPGDAGLYTVVAFSDERCQSEPVTVRLDVLPSLPPSAVEGPVEVCPGTTFRLSAANPNADGYEFSGPSGQLINSAGPTITIENANASVAGSWTVRLLNGTCLSQPGPPLRINLLPGVTAAARVTPDPVCEGNDLRLIATNVGAGGTYRWSGPEGFSEVGRTPIIQNVTRENTGLYNLTVTDGAGCTDETTVDITVRPGITINAITAIGNECLEPGQVVSLSADVTPTLNPGAYRYEWTAPDGTISENANLTIATPTPAANGTYRLRVENALGCRSPQASFDLELDFAPLAPGQPTTDNARYDYCFGESIELRTNPIGGASSYLWSGPNGFRRETATPVLTLEELTASRAGNYSVVALEGNCSSPSSSPRAISVTLPPDVSAAVLDPVCTGGPIRFSTQDLAGVTYAWSGPNGFTSSEVNPTIPGADPAANNGTYQLIVSRNDCPAAPINVDVTVRPLPQRPALDPVTAICADEPGTSITLTVAAGSRTPGATYQFIQVPGGHILNSGPDPDLNIDDLTVFAGLTQTNVRVTATVDGCTSEPSPTTTVALNRTFGLNANAGVDTTVCPGQLFLGAERSSQVSGRWTQVQGNDQASFVDPTDPSTRVTGITETGSPYQFVWTLNNGACVDFSSDTVTIGVTPAVVADAGENLVACIGSPVILNPGPAPAGATGRWTQRATQALIGVEIDEPANPNTTISGLRTDNVYTFTWVVSDRCGESSDVIAVSVSDPDPRAGANQRICAEDPTISLRAVSPSVGSTGRWYGADSDLTFSNPAGPATTVTDLIPGENRLVWELDNGVCGDRSRDTLLVNFLLPPLPAADVVTVPFQGSSDFNPTANDDNPFDAVIDFGGLTPDLGNLMGNGDGTYSFVAPANFVGVVEATYLVITEGCEDTPATVRFEIGEDASCEIPNIFTPNGDGVNDNFVIPCLLNGEAFPRSEVTVYNQWGDEVFRSGQPYRNDWSGTFQGGDLPVGTYFYLVNRGDGTQTMTGDVRIER
ncbi:gliding motility-associated C-terminal domain-containing protein [Lewinella sp. 4G2]|uniref:gliding motility-associated C-terminal domain-containing protein n=1 Tax=Lewinella sp. 4G2 TaxID=1803372 RepID=UPI0007B4E612|nr:gliding motility-associated C-terminal domain-containing protein [Lewinella sp. 4G2]OAV43509.1 hypothetical protein A3850_002920 [Lewinella sp. 4G2]